MSFARSELISDNQHIVKSVITFSDNDHLTVMQYNVVVLRIIQNESDNFQDSVKSINCPGGIW
jgi:hypothetical protein